MKWLLGNLIVLMPFCLFGQVKLESKTSLPKKVEETSGLETCDGHHLLTHNDSGGEPIIYEIDQEGTLIKEHRIRQASNTDWEELTIDNDGNLYIADFGNNANKRKDLTIYIAKDFCRLNGKAAVKKITFSYENQNNFPPADDRKIFDAEALIHFNDSLFIFTKNRTQPYNGMVYLYGLPDQPGNYTASLLDSAKLGGKSMNFWWVTAADIRPDGKEITLLSMDKVWRITNFKGSNFLKGHIKMEKLNAYSQKEAVVYTNDSTIFVTDEKFKIFGLQLYQFKY